MFIYYLIHKIFDTLLQSAHMLSYVKLRRVQLLMTVHLKSYGMSQVNTPCLNPSQKPVLDLPIPEAWEAELTKVIGYVCDVCACLFVFFVCLCSPLSTSAFVYRDLRGLIS